MDADQEGQNVSDGHVVRACVTIVVDAHMNRGEGVGRHVWDGAMAGFVRIMIRASVCWFVSYPKSSSLP